MLIYGSGVLTALDNGQPVAPPESVTNQVGPGFGSVTIMNESPWGLAFVDANTGSYPITPWAVATIPVSPGDSWHITPQESLFISGNYLMPPGVSNSQAQVVAQFSRNATAYTIRELFTISATEITGTTQVSVDTSGGPVDVSGTVDATITNATIDVTGSTVDLATGTTVDISGTVDVTGPVTISAGQNGVNVSTDTPPVLAGNLTIQPTLDSDSVILTPPPNCLGVQIVGYPAGNGDPIYNAEGVSSTNKYLTVAPGVNKGGVWSFLFDGDEENIQFTVTGWTNQGSLVAEAAAIYWLLSPSVVAVQNNQFQPLYTIGVQGASSASVQTVPEAPQGEVSVGTNLTSTGVVSIIAGVAGESVRLRKGILWSNTNTTGTWSLVTTSGVNLVTVVGSQTGILPLDFEGYPLPAGEGVELAGNTLGTTVWISGYLLFDQF